MFLKSHDGILSYQPTSTAKKPSRPNGLCCLAGGFAQATFAIIKIKFLKSGRFRDSS
jgi:hypothetical protein